MNCGLSMDTILVFQIVLLSISQKKLTQYCFVAVFSASGRQNEAQISKKIKKNSSFFKNHLYKAKSMWYNVVGNFGKRKNGIVVTLFLANQSIAFPVFLKAEEKKKWKE